MRRARLGFPRIKFLWNLYAEAMHSALFVDLLKHEVPQSLALLSAFTFDFFREHGTLAVVGIVVLLRILRPVEEKEPRKELTPRGEKRKKIERPRDKRGRFIRVGPGKSPRSRRKAHRGKSP